MRFFLMMCMAASAAALQGGPACEASVTLSTARVAHAASLVLKAAQTCNQGMGANCTKEVNDVASAVSGAQKTANATAKECGPTTAACGKDVAVAQTALDNAAPLVSKAQADCSKNEIECNAALVSVGTQLTRAAVGFNQAGKDCKTAKKVATPACEELIVIALTDLGEAGDYLQEAIVACNNGTSAQCAADISGVVSNVADASNAVSKAVTACGGAGTACAQDITAATAAIASTSQKLAQATADCSDTGNKAQCIVDLLDVSDDLGHAVQDIILATTDCKSNFTIGTPVCEAEVVLVVTRVGEASRAVIAASAACRNGTAAECTSAVTTASTAVRAASTDAKRAVGECGDPTATCGKHVAVADATLETAVALMSNATTTCGRTGIDSTHCQIDLFMVETELARADAFALESATQCSKKNSLTVDTPVCEAEVVLVLTRINDAARDLATASNTCVNASTAACKAAVAAASSKVTAANTDAKRAVGECGDSDAKCGKHVATASTTLETAVALMDNATSTCGRTGVDKAHCRIDLLMVDTEVARAAAFAAEASTMCNGKKAEKLGTAVCEAEVALVLTRLVDASKDLVSATSACVNGTSTGCKSAVAAATTTLTAAKTDSKRAVGECGDPNAKCGKNVATTDTSLDIAMALMDNATTTCGRTGIDKVHCQIDLIMVDTEVARAAVFAGEASTTCTGKNEMASPLCTSAITVGAARIMDALEQNAKAGASCANQTNTCSSTAASASTAVVAAGKAVNMTIVECPTNAPCGTELVAAQSALMAALAPAEIAAEKCGVDNAACLAQLLRSSTSLLSGESELLLANTACKNATHSL
eukprot:TRINITY_DN802_c0_g1_i3.p1 TRINITY_DN802_c0_g1~~TRINITY_DN802_c0_g1_i3.p1  ORF type:complete len:830 (+),score=233.95 TRINITY_DN802_c0_g1_i3:51-2540(+)